MTEEELTELENVACPGRRGVRRAVHRQHDGDRLRADGHLADGGEQRPGNRPAEGGRGGACRRAWPSRLIGRRLTARTVLTRQALENAIAGVAASGGSTNAVLHLLAIAHEARVAAVIDDFDRVGRMVPVLADLKPGGRFAATEFHRAGGNGVLARRLVELGRLDGEAITVTGRTIGEEAIGRDRDARPGGRAAGRAHRSRRAGAS